MDGLKHPSGPPADRVFSDLVRWALLGTLGGVREARIKIPAASGRADYHCWSKTVNGEWLFDDVAKEVLRKQLWQVADFCGVQLLTHTILSNHFHAVVRVPQTEPVSDAELLRRYRVLHPRPTRWAIERLEAIAAELRRDSSEARAWRERQLRLMGDVSQFMKLLKQRFSIWFNHAHRRFGPLWCDRFKSTLIGPGALEAVVAYVDLNCVRAGLVSDPKDYRYCGYAEAVAGAAAARHGLQAVVGGGWVRTQAAYRERLFGVGGTPREGAAHIPPEQVQKAIAAGGVLPLSTLLRCRLKYFTHGAILGTRAFVATHTPALARHGGPCTLPKWSSDQEFAVLRGIRVPVVG
jgi:putative transposase